MNYAVNTLLMPLALMMSCAHTAPVSSADDLVNLAKQALVKKLSDSYEDLTITNTSTPKSYDIALSEFKVTLPRTQWLSKRLCVILQHEHIHIPIWFSIKAYQKVLVSTHPLKGQRELMPEDFSLEKRNIVGVRGTPVQRLPIQHWLAKSVNNHQIITQELLTQTPDVQQGETVEVIAKKNQITITTQATAETQGNKGQIITMKNTSSHQRFKARVTAPHQAEALS